MYQSCSEVYSVLRAECVASIFIDFKINDIKAINFHVALPHQLPITGLMVNDRCLTALNGNAMHQISFDELTIEDILVVMKEIDNKNYEIIY